MNFKSMNDFGREEALTPQHRLGLVADALWSLLQLTLLISSGCILAQQIEDAQLWVHLGWWAANVFSLMLDELWALSFGAGLVTIWILARDQDMLAALGTVSAAYFQARAWVRVLQVAYVLEGFRALMAEVALGAFARLTFAIISGRLRGLWLLLPVGGDADPLASSQLQNIGEARLVDLWHEKTINLLLRMQRYLLVFDALHLLMVLEQPIEHSV